jgi:hypothetical protein
MMLYLVNDGLMEIAPTGTVYVSFLGSEMFLSQAMPPLNSPVPDIDYYRLTPAGLEFLDAWIGARPFGDDETTPTRLAGRSATRRSPLLPRVGRIFNGTVWVTSRRQSVAAALRSDARFTALATNQRGAEMGLEQASTIGRRFKAAQWVAGLILFAGLVALAGAFFTVRVCDQQLADTGSVVTVCRHPQMTDPPVVAIGAIILAALGAFFTEISGFGITLKRAVEETNRIAQAAEQTANEAKETVNEVAGDLAEGIGAALRTRDDQGLVEPARNTDPVARLAARYNEIRWTMPSGLERIAEMTKVLMQMQELLRGVRDFDLTGHLRSTDRGMRLAGIAYLNTNPDPARANALADVALAEDKPFGEYWALVTLRKLVGTDCTALDNDRRIRLRARQAELTRGTDRAIEISRLLRTCPPR